MIIIFLILGICVGFLSGFFGIGGGIVLIPVLAFLGIPMKMAIGISVVQRLFTSSFGMLLSYRKNKINIKKVFFVGSGGFIGALGSGFIIKYTPEYILTSIFIFAVIFAIYRFHKSKISTGENERESNFILFIINAIVGLISSSIGIGGGLFIVPSMVSIMRYSTKKAISFSLIFIFFSSVSAFISISSVAHIDYGKGIIIGLSSLIGVFFGVKCTSLIDEKLHKKMAFIFYVIILFLTLYKTFL